MTREELRDYVDEQRSLNMIPYHVYSALIDGLDALEQESILDKIRAEINTMPCAITLTKEVYVNRDEVINILGKYKAESEGKNE